MSVRVNVKYDLAAIAKLTAALSKGTLRKVMSMSGSTALRDMRSEASKRIRQRKRIKVSYIQRALTMLRPKDADPANMEWALKVSGEPVPLVAYPHRQTKKGVSVEVNRGKRTLVAGTFIATMRSGHKGVFKRVGKARLPIKELRGSRPVDALLHRGEAEGVAERGAKSFSATFLRLLGMEINR